MPDKPQAAPAQEPFPDDDVLIRLALDYAKAILGEPLQIGLEVIQAACEELDRVLSFHQRQFRDAGKPCGREHVIRELRRGSFAFGQRPDCDLLADFFLARFYGAGLPAAARAFLARFQDAIQRWASQFAPDDPDLAASLPADLLLPRAKAGPRIHSYRAEGPLDGWLKQVVLSQASRRRRERGRVVSAVADPNDSAILESGAVAAPSASDPGPAEQLAARDCIEHLAPLLRQAFDVLPPRERTVLMMALVDGVPQKQIARLLRLPEYTVSREKTRAIERVHREFFQLARQARGMDNQTVRDCLDLILESFPGAGIELRSPQEETPT